jgi:hypothetical protein
MTIHICASRIFAPISLVDAAIRELSPDAIVRSYGSTQVSRRAVLAATSIGCDARNVTLSRDRAELLAGGMTPGDDVWCFVARDPLTKQPTEGIGQIMDFLTSQGATFRRIDSPLPGRVSVAVSTHRDLVDRVFETRNTSKRQLLTNRALKTNNGLLELRNEYERRLSDGWSLRVGDPEADDRWWTWLRCYEALSDEIEETLALLVDRSAA